MSGAPGSPARGRAVAVAAVAALALAALVWLVRSGTPATTSPSGTGAAAPSPALASPASTQPALDGPAAPGLAVPASVQDDAAAGPESVQRWNQVPMAARLSDLGPLARPVYDGLQKARAVLAPCFAADDEEQTAHPRAQDPEAWGAAILTLQLEARQGEVVVVGAPLQELGTSSPGLVECCERALRGLRFPAPGATPGKRYRLQHQLTP